jgi:hypothetical protein
VGVGQREVIFAIQSVLDQRIDMINVKLAFMEEKINEFITDEASATLALKQSSLQLFSLFGVQP